MMISKAAKEAMAKGQSIILAADGYSIGRCSDDCEAIHVWLVVEDGPAMHLDLDVAEAEEMIRKLQTAINTLRN
jgi:hypothetical protein